MGLFMIENEQTFVLMNSLCLQRIGGVWLE